LVPTMKLPSSQEMRYFDEKTISGGVAALSLMERAGEEMFKQIAKHFLHNLDTENPILVLAGPGNNGGDGLVVARHLAQNGFVVKVVIAGASKYSEEFLTNFEALKKVTEKLDAPLNEVCFVLGESKISPNEAQEITNSDLTRFLSEAYLIVDALLGTGSKGEPRDIIKVIIDLVKPYTFKKSIVSLDIPSGINADTGETAESSINAELTITVQAIKRGLLQHPAREHSNAIEVVDIGIDTSGNSEFTLLTPNHLPRLNERTPNINKGKLGRVLVVGGSASMPGAPVLSSEAALRVGSGLVFLASAGKIGAVSVPAEIMQVDVAVDSGYFAKDSLKLVSSYLEQKPVVVLGPGLGQSPETITFVRSFIKELIKHQIKAVVDADALNIIASSDIDLSNNEFVFTPHPGEAARLLDMSIEEVERDRYSSVKALSEKLSGVVVLKGAATVTFNGTQGFVNSTGNPYLATPGSGDVLSGIIAGFMAQKLSPTDAASLGVYIHGLAGDRAVASNRGPITASSLFEFLPKTVYEFTGKNQ